jgi:DNA topoisomerase I
MKIVATERELLDPGFRRAYQPLAKVGDLPLTPAGAGRLTKLKHHEKIKPSRVQIHLVAAIPIAMTEAALIRSLQANGIGRPSTYAATIETLVARGYATRNARGELASTERGRAVCTFLLERFSAVFTLGFTAQMESQLDALTQDQVTYQDVLRSFWSLLQTTLEQT